MLYTSLSSYTISGVGMNVNRRGSSIFILGFSFLSAIICLISLAFLPFINVLLIYISLGCINSFLVLIDMTRYIQDGQIEDIGIARIDGQFRVLSWGKFIIVWFALSFVVIPIMFWIFLTAL